jgi:hypothetical protein
MGNLLERAINTDYGDRAAKLIQKALGRERRSGELLLPEKVAKGSRAAGSDHRRLVKGRGTFSGMRGAT